VTIKIKRIHIYVSHQDYVPVSCQVVQPETKNKESFHIAGGNPKINITWVKTKLAYFGVGKDLFTQ
jgi:hypothetical protein